MARKFFIFSVVVAASITLSPIPITARQGDAQPSGKARSSQPPQPQRPPDDAQGNSTGDIRGTDKAPFVIQIQPPIQVQSASGGQDSERREKATDSGWFAGATIFIYVLQLVVFGVQAYMLKSTIDTMERIANEQRGDFQQTIAQATSSANSMNSIAQSLAANVTQLTDAMEINKRIGEATEKSLRLAHTPHFTLAPEHFLCLGRPEEFPREYQLTLRLTNTGHVQARFLKAEAACWTHKPFPQVTIGAQTRMPGQMVHITIPLTLMRTEIEAFEEFGKPGLDIVVEVSVEMHHPIDGPIWHTHHQRILVRGNIAPQVLDASDYPGRHQAS